MKKLLILLLLLALVAPAFGAVKKAKPKPKAKPKLKITAVKKAAVAATSEAAAKAKVAAAPVPIKDLSVKDPQYPYVIKLVSGEVMTLFPDRTFKGGKTVSAAELSKIVQSTLVYLTKQDILPFAEAPAFSGGTKPATRFQLAAALSGMIDLVYARYGAPTVEAKPAVFKDVKPKHWAAKSVSRVAGLGLMRGIGKGNFGGSGSVSRLNVAVSVAKVIALAEEASGKLVEEKAAVVPAPPAASRVEQALRIPAKPQAYISSGWGNVNEAGSGTNNWLGYNAAASYGDSFNLGKFSGNYEITGKYGFNQIVYLVPSGGGGTKGGTNNESRYELELNTIYPVVEFHGISGKLLLGAKYINLSNPVAPTNFTGFNAGLVSGARVWERNLLLRAFYSLPLVRAQVSPSVLGQPAQLFDYEAALDAEFFSYPVLFGLSGETMTLTGGGARYYTTLFARYFLF